jgi:threonyl-tRNA synthetase
LPPSYNFVLFAPLLRIRSDFRPLWISPRQVIVLPVAHAFDDYASEVASRLHDAGFYAEANLSSETLNKRILEAQVAQWNYIVGMFLSPQHRPLTPSFKGVGSIPSLNPCLSKNRAFKPSTLRVLMVVVGQVEQDGKSVNVRIRDDVSTRKQGVPIALEEFISTLTELRDSRSLSHALGEIASSP